MTKMQKGYTILSGKNTMSESGILKVFFDTFSSKNEYRVTFTNNYNQSCSVDFRGCSFTGKEKDEETGYGYFGARYMDHELMTMWLSVDPMADEYPSISPYAYCAWNPVKLVDPDGRDWVVVFDHENKTVTIEAKYVVKKGDEDAKKSAENAVSVWNSLSGEYGLKVGKDNYIVNFDLSVIDDSEVDASNSDRNLNTYRLKSSFSNPNVRGETNRNSIYVLASDKDDFVVSSHEVGHSLGLIHPIGGQKGLMEEDGGMRSGHHEITTDNVRNIIDLALHPYNRDPNWHSGVGGYREKGTSSVDILKPLNINLYKRNKK